LAVRSNDLAQVQSEILQRGVSLRLHYDIAALCQHLRHGREAHALVLIAAPPDPACQAARALRKVDPEVSLVALISDLNDSLLLQALHAGFNVCWPGHTPAGPLVDQLLHFLRPPAALLSRERPSRAGSANPRWRLDSRAWSVQAPSGAKIQLTTAERALIVALYMAPGQQLSHADMLQAVDEAGCSVQRCRKRSPAGAYEAAATRRLSVLMSRLRRKFHDAGADMPIRSLRGVGYELCADFQEPAAQEPAEGHVVAAPC